MTRFTISGLRAAARQALLTAAALAVVVVGATSASAAGKVKLVFAASGADKGALKEVTVYLANRMKELTNGRVQIDRFMGGALGGEVQLNELLIAGQVDIILAGVFADSNYPEYSIGSIPFLLPSWKEKQAFYDNPVFRAKVAAKLKKQKLVFLEPITMGQQYITSNRALREPADMKGLKFRVAQDKAQIAVYGSLGALITPMSSKQIFSALQTGVVDAQVNTLSNNYGRQLWEVQKYLVRGRHILWPWNLATSEMALAKLTPADRKALRQTAREMRDVAAKAVEKQEAPLIKSMTKKHGMQYIEWDAATLKRWQAAARKGIEEVLATKDPEIAAIVKKMAGL